MTYQSIAETNYGLTQLVDARIGTAYPVIYHIEKNLEYIKHVSYNLGFIYNVSENLESLNVFLDNIEIINNLALISNEVVLLANSIDALNNINDNLTTLNYISTNTDAILDAADKAQKWADNPENVIVESGLYSAKHWALKASAIAIGSFTATDIPFSPFGNVGSFNLQNAIQEIDSEKMARNTYDPQNIQADSFNRNNHTGIGTPSDVALGNVDNTSDINKPVSTAQSNAIGTKIAINDIATVLHYQTKTNNKIISTDSVWGAMIAVMLTSDSTVNWDMSTGFDFILIIGTNAVLANPLNPKIGQRGRIRIQQDGAGNHTLALSSYLKTINADGIILSTDAGKVDYLDYDCVSATEIRVSLSNGWA